ncbi:Isonitrile hydratase [Labrenzia sp. THAF191b]|uniref:GlxA family transcriptional regulator n=1 Tax=unclassified Labrenzia TaxID=2648686 RepID=UPI0012679516|nr:MULTISPECIES: DJ-1/PfpI family protein [unclassified Labrenzia]QFS96736.1 Isonitrile hydratase [Labrenzia sp. THAF191b]QFT03051.1 Isonitrile hydratase [Labrenzia sp. THAF191a]QFT14593.1 Isonitrile hydratase [Labrenzia sp. THAF187b]
MDKTLRQIDILLFDGLNILDVAGPAQVFSSANEDGTERYRLRFVSMDGMGVTSSCGLRLQVDTTASTNGRRDLLIPGGTGVDQAMHDRMILDFLATWPSEMEDRRVISICSGALVLANAGLLNGRKATTHWRRARQVRRQFPEVRWSTDELYHIDGNVMTSAGVASGIDLALEIIKRDHGGALALAVARELVVYLKRAGGQTQFADLLEAQFSGDRELGRLLDALQDNPGRDWTLELMAEVAGLTPRTLSRRFSASAGLTPVKYLERYRLKRAADVLSGGAPVGSAIRVSGFSDFQQMQRAFKRHLNTTVGEYREKFADS